MKTTVLIAYFVAIKAKSNAKKHPCRTAAVCVCVTHQLHSLSLTLSNILERLNFLSTYFRPFFAISVNSALLTKLSYAQGKTPTLTISPLGPTSFNPTIAIYFSLLLTYSLYRYSIYIDICARTLCQILKKPIKNSGIPITPPRGQTIKKKKKQWKWNSSNRQ